MFDKNENTKEIETIIGPSVKVEGTFLGKGNVQVEGKVVGKLDTSGNVIVGQQAKITADITAQSITVAGEVKGNIAAEDMLHLLPSAKVVGNIRAKSLAIDQGAQFEGKSSMHASAQDAEAARLKQSAIPKKS